MERENIKKFFNELTDIVVAERITILLVILAVVGFRVMLHFLNSSPDTPSEINIITSNKEPVEPKKSTHYEQNTPKKNIKYTSFNPNAASYDDFINLGISPKVAHTIINYRNKGGMFYKKSDLKKIYGLSDETYSKLAPYILIDRDRGHKSEKKPKYAPKKNEPIDINTASVEDWMSLKGIGKYRANKIVNFREKLGGFVSVEQVSTTYGIPDSTFQKIKPLLRNSSKQITKININKADEKTLAAHPYIAPWQAEDIIKNRPIYGLDDLYELYTFRKKEKNKRVEPYIEF